MNAHNEISEWIRLAEMDLSTAHHMFETFWPKPLEIACFHSQQSAEKMLKCFLVSQAIEPPKTHDMQVLIEMCAEINSGFNDIYEEAATLTNYAVRLRYPAELEIAERDAEDAIKNADKIMLFVKNNLPEDAAQSQDE